jgi:uncharacterized membrane protein
MEVESLGTDGFAAPLWFDGALHGIALGFEAVGVAAIALSVLIATVQAGRTIARGNDWGATYHLFRTTLARGILLGLEFLVAADIIGTVAVDPTLQNLSVLGLIVLIRTFLSFALQLEISGRWPWQKAPAGDSSPRVPQRP